MRATRKPALRGAPDEAPEPGVLERRAAVRSLLADGAPNALFVTGLAGAIFDVLAAVGDAPNVFPLVGTMGAATMVGLGLALAQPNRRVIVVTGDGELLMNLGSLATVGVLDPPNLSILCIDNEHYGETGWQESHTARGVDLAKMAEAGGIHHVRTVRRAPEIPDAAALLFGSGGTGFVLLKAAPTAPPQVPCCFDAAWNKGRFRRALLGES